MPPNMYRKLGLCDIATYDMTAQGGCIPVQIMHCAVSRGWAAGTGGRGEQKRQHELKPVFKDQKEIMDLFDQIFAKLYVGEPVDPDVDEEPEPENPNIVKCEVVSEYYEPVFGQPRAYPYEHEGWREVGVTTTMVEQLCRFTGMA